MLCVSTSSPRSSEYFSFSSMVINWGPVLLLLLHVTYQLQLLRLLPLWHILMAFVYFHSVWFDPEQKVFARLCFLRGCFSSSRWILEHCPAK